MTQANTQGLFQRFEGTFILDALRTPMVDYMGAFADANPIDMGICAAKAVLARAGVNAQDVDSVITGNMAPGGFDQFYVARHIGLYAGVPLQVPALNVQRICGTGFELFRQAGEQVATGAAQMALLVGTESMTRNPMAMFDHRAGFKLGAPIAFKDYMWEALNDPAAVSMIQTAENLAQKYGISREAVDAFAARSFARAVAAQEAAWFDGEITPVANTVFELDRYKPRHLRLAGKPPKGVAVSDWQITRDTHPRPTPPEVLAKLRTVFKDGVQTGGNSSALTDAAAAALVGNAEATQKWKAETGKTPLARVAAAAVVGVPPELMGIGPAPAIRLLLARAGLDLSDIARFEINEAQGAQTLAVARELGLRDAVLDDKLNVHGGAIALGHPLAATGVRLTLTVARQLKQAGQRWGVASACVGGGQGIALLIENPEAA
jgi:acetyl-CoA C-acetyltransferase